MATVGLAAVGTAIAPGFGTSIGAAIGGIIDQTLLIPALFKAPAVKVGKLDGLQLQSASEGSPIHWCRGPAMRVAGTVIWMPPISEHKSTEKVGPKGAKQERTTYHYTADVAVAICAGPIVGVSKIWADGKLIYGSPDAVSVSSNQISANYRDEVASSSYYLLKLDSPNGGPDLSQFAVGTPVTVAGFANAANNGTFKVHSRRLQGDGASYLQLRLAKPGTPPVDESAGNTVTLTQQPNGVSPRASSTTIYTGSDSQTADATIVAREGANAPAFRGIAYAVFDALKLASFGNRLPQFNFLVEADAAGYTARDAIADVLVRGGLTPDQFDVCAVSSAKLVDGLMLSGPQQVGHTIEEIMLAHDIDVREVGGRLVFRDRTDAVASVVTTAELAASPGRRGFDRSTPRVARFSEPARFAVAREVNVTYLDTATDYQQGSQRERRIDGVGDTVRELRLGLSMTAAEARQIAHRMLWLEQAQRRRVSFVLPPGRARVLEGDLLTLTADGETFDVRVAAVSHGADHLVRCEGYVEIPRTLDGSSSADAGSVTIPEVYQPPVLELFAADLPPLTDADAVSAGFWFGSAAADINAEWLGGGLYSSESAAGTYTSDAALPPEATLGRATTALAATGAAASRVDNANTVTVDLMHGTLESRDLIDVLNGANRALLGDEIIGFTTATLVADSTWTLSGILRGLRDTFDHADEHAVGDRFVLLEDMQRVEVGTALINQPRYLKAVPSFAEVADVDAELITVTGESLRPFAPCQIAGTRDGSNNLTITWRRRTRLPFRLLGGVICPLVEDIEAYEVDVMSGETVLRTLEVSSETASYSAANQTTDGLTPGDPVTVRVYQLSGTIGRGNRAEATV